MTRSVFIFTPYVRTWTLNLNLSDELVEEISLNIFLLAKLCYVTIYIITDKETFLNS
jgi:hypothetical protein